MQCGIQRGKWGYRMDINQIGFLIGCKRYERKISAGELCEGICSQSFLTRLESGERGCEKIIAESLMQRIGLSDSRFLYFMDFEEELWMTAKDNLTEAVFSGSDTEIERCKKAYLHSVLRENQLHIRFLKVADCVLFWKKIKKSEKDGQKAELKGKLENLQENLLEAWNMTRKGYSLDGDCPEMMDFTELYIKSLSVKVSELLGKHGQAIRDYRYLLKHMEKAYDPEDCARIYPQIACQLLWLLLPVSGTEEEQERIYGTCIRQMVSEGKMEGLAELTEYRRAFLTGKKMSEQSRMEVSMLEERLELLYLGYETYHVTPKNWFDTLWTEQEEVFSFAETIRNRRNAFEWTQQKLADGVCDAVTISRIENKASKGRKADCAALMNKLHLPGGAAFLTVQTGKTDVYELVTEIVRLSKFARHEEVEPLYEKLKEKVKHDRYVDQFLLHKEVTIAHDQNRIDDEQHWKLQEEALYMTLPKKEPAELEHWVFTRTEAMIINAFSYSCKKSDRLEKAMEWLELLRRFYERQNFQESHYAKGYILTLRNLGNLLGETGEFERAIQYEDTAIRLALEMGKANCLFELLYDRGWNMEQLWKTGQYTKEESRPYIRAALVLAHLYEDDDSVAFIEQHWRHYYK